MRGASALQKLAELNGILLQYETRGMKRTASEPSLRAVLKALGVAAETEADIRESLRHTRERPWIRGVEPVTVVWEGAVGTLQLHLSAGLADELCRGEARLENGECIKWDFRPSQARWLGSATIEGAEFRRYSVDLPPLPRGCHELTLQTGGQLFRSWTLVAPAACYSLPELARSWGVFMPIYAARSETSWGAGNLRDYAALSEWVARLGGGFVGALPILAGFLEQDRCECSPYAPVSRLFWNEFYIDVTAAAEFSRCRQAQRRVHSETFERQLARFRASRLVDYPAEMQARREILEILARKFFTQPSSQRDEFEAFVRQRPEVEAYARFRATCENLKKPWREWEPRLRAGRLRAGDFAEDGRRYHLYSQWVAQEQVESLLTRQAEGAAKLYLDLPMGVHPDGFDAWHEREAFVEGVSAGAPPDQFFSLGQDWGFAPPHPARVREQGYPYFRKVLAFHMRHTGLLRLDHVMSLHRLFWVPHGFEAKDGVYVRYPAQELCALLALESHRHKTVLVGENLGTVPAEVNVTLRRRRIRTMYVLQFSVDPATGAIAAPGSRDMSSLGTHDTPTFAAFWRGEDIEDRLNLKLISADEAKTERRQRQTLIERAKDYLRRCGWLPEGKATLEDCLRACLSFLAASKTEMLLVSLEDLWLEREPQNVPGTTQCQRPNWRGKSRFTLEQICQMRRVKMLLTELAKLREDGAR